MALTVPQFGSPYVQCNVSILATDLGMMGVGFSLTDDQIAEWSDADLAEKVEALKQGLAGFAAPGSPASIVVTWSSDASTEIIHVDTAS